VTEDYRSEPAARTSPERFRVTLVPAAGAQSSREFYPFLLRRLRIFATVTAVASLFLFGAFLWHFFGPRGTSLVGEARDNPRALLFGFVSFGLPLTVSAVATVFLWRRPPASPHGLRAVELVVIGTHAAVFLLAMTAPQSYGALEYAAGKPPGTPFWFVSSYAYSNAARWALLLVGYATLIPNTGRRSAAVLSVLALSPLVFFAAWSHWVRPLPTSIVLDVLSVLAVFLSLAAANGVFAASRIEVLRRQVAAARKLGQYQLKERLGAGGMGEVYLAEHVLLRRPCAVKLIRPERAGDPVHLRRFEREVQVTATLTHPNTVQIYDYGHAEDGTFYYVMEHLPGPTLEELVREYGPLGPARAVHFLRQVCGALAEAHGHRLVHRDIKPSNVIVCERGGIHDTAKLLDFGLVLRPARSPDEKLSHEGAVAGTSRRAGGRGRPQ
jgi:serine/threonine-protein kinase